MGEGIVRRADAQTPPPADAAAIQLPQVSVEGNQAGYQTSLPSLSKLTQPLLDTPQSISVIPQQLMQDQGVTNMRDALRNVPGISLGAGEAGAQGDNLTIRGFSARNDFYLDGMRDFGSYYRDPFNLQEVEVLKGPSSVLFGRGSTGGTVNQVSKQPQLAPITSGWIGFGTDGTKRFTSDINRSIDGLDGAAVRLNLMGDLNGTAGRDVAEFRRFGVAPSISFGLGTSTRLTLSYLHQQEDNIPDYGVPWLFGSPAPVPTSNFYGFANSDYLRTNVDIGTARLEHDITDSVTVRDQFRYGSYGRSGRITEPQVVYLNPVPLTQITPAALLSVNRNMIAVQSEETFLQNQAEVIARFRTGPLEHAMVAGLEFGQETSSPTRFTYANVPRTNLLYPDSSMPFLSAARFNTSVDTTSSTLAAYITDTIKLGEHWELLGGVRWDRFQTSYSQLSTTTLTSLSRTDSMPSWRAALVYKPLPNGSVYFAYGTSFNPSAESLSLATSSADLAPEENETYEVGTKWDVLDNRLTLNGALFQITKQNARVPDPNNSAFNILAGSQRVRGFELGANGNITEAWQIFAGYAYLDSQVTSSTSAAVATLGEPLANTPMHTLSVWTTYQLPWHGLQIGGGINFVSSRIASSSPNSTTGQIERAPGYYTLQAMASYPIAPGVDLQVNGYNLTDQKFYDLLHPSHVVPGAGRAVLFSANFKL
ncbi:MAG: TonB-dependent siderophore receptor [Alphaproteobacteria bacterium]|nr:TonB-dependent siderophore receptor [Alphaproteobacteria bacterium]